MPAPRKVDFYGLPRPVQDRFAAATRRSAPPAPLLYARAPRTVAWAYLGVSAVLVVVAGVLLGLGLGNTRNAMSDDAMYRTIVAAGTVPAYQAYLAQGGRHSDDVRDVLLPRAQLRDAEAQGSVDADVEAVQAFSNAHPSSRIDAEITAALRRAMLAALDAAKKAGTVVAIDDLAKKYPNHTIDPEIKAARHAFFTQAMDAWKKKAQPDAATSAFMERILAWSEGQGPGSPAAQIRFRMKPSKTLDDADKSIMRSGHYPAPDALPSKYVTIDAMRPREQRVATALAQAFSDAFPPDVLAMRAGDPLDPDAPVPNDAPTLVVDYTAEWSRANSLIEHPPTVIAQILFQFDSTFAIPDAAPLKIAARAWRPAEVWRIKGGQMTREDYEQKVYDMVFDTAFDLLQKKLTDTLL